MLANKVITIPTSQDSPCHVWHHRGHEHDGGKTVTTHIEFKKTAAHSGGFPSNSYHVSVTPSQPCAVSVTNKSQHGFEVTLTSLDGKPLSQGEISMMVIA